MLEQTFTQLAASYTTDEELIRQLWGELCEHYNGPGRHYHTLAHLQNLITELQPIKPEISDWDAVLFALFYHDLIYNPASNRNEEDSADIAAERLSTISFPEERKKHCCTSIIATKGHTETGNLDTDLFTDADLSVLGKPWELYATYTRQIRQEYSQYPDAQYHQGRSKVIAHFLAMPRIFKTDYFSEKYEQQARHNLARELKLIAK